MSKTLFALLVALVSITGWQVLQKYKGEGFDELSALRNKWNGWVGKSPTPVANAPHPGYVQLDPYGRPYPQNAPSQYGQVPYAQSPAPIPYGTQNGYAPANQYGQPTQPTYPQNYGQPTVPGYGQQPQLTPLGQNPLVHMQPSGYGQTPQPTTVGYPQTPGYGTQPYTQPGYGQTPYGQAAYDPRTQQQAYNFGADPQQPVGQQGGQNGTIRIASFNIQVFGESKLRKPDAMRVLVDLVRRFDVVAIQEIRSVSDEIIPRFIQELNVTGRHYDFVIGPREGRTSSKEQYVYVYDTATIECDRSSVFSAQNPNNALHRTPLVASFRARNAPPQQAFTFTLINIHTDPDEVKTEIPALVEVVRAVREQLRGEDDIFLMGDLNADESKLGPLMQIPNYTPIVSRTPTNTRGTEQYDNIFYPRDRTPEYTGRWGVVDFAHEYGLSMTQALEVSDHRPIWAEFGVYENQPAASGQFVQQPQAALR